MEVFTETWLFWAFVFLFPNSIVYGGMSALLKKYRSDTELYYHLQSLLGGLHDKKILNYCGLFNNVLTWLLPFMLWPFFSFLILLFIWFAWVLVSSLAGQLLLMDNVVCRTGFRALYMIQPLFILMGVVLLVFHYLGYL